MRFSFKAVALGVESRDADNGVTYHTLNVAPEGAGDVLPLSLPFGLNGDSPKFGQVVDLAVDADIAPVVNVKDGRGWASKSNQRLVRFTVVAIDGMPLDPKDNPKPKAAA